MGHLLAPPGQRRHEADAVGGAARLRTRHVEQRRQPVLEGAREGGGAPGSDPARPGGDRRHLDASLVDGALQPAHARRAREEGGVRPAVEGGAVVAREHDERVVGDPELLERVEDRADLRVEVGDHGCVGRARTRVGEVALGAEVGRLVPLARERLQPLGRHLQRGVGDRRRVVEEEGLVRVLAQEGEGLLLHDVVGIDPGVVAGVVLLLRLQGLGEPLVGVVPGVVAERQPLSVAPQVRGVVVVRDALAQVATEEVEALVLRRARGPGPAEAPLAHCAGGVARVLQLPRQGRGASGQGPLTLGLALAPAAVLPVVAHLAVPGVQSREEDAAAGGADRAARVVLREAHAARGDRVDVRGRDQLRAEGAHLAVAEVVGQEEHDVGRALAGRLGLALRGPRGRAGEEREGEESAREEGARLHAADPRA